MNKKPHSAGNPVDNTGSGGGKPAEKPVSLAPLDFEEALKGLLKVKPDRGKPKG